MRLANTQMSEVAKGTKEKELSYILLRKLLVAMYTNGSMILSSLKNVLRTEIIKYFLAVIALQHYRDYFIPHAELETNGLKLQSILVLDIFGGKETPCFFKVEIKWEAKERAPASSN